MHADVDDNVTDVEEEDDFDGESPDETVVMSEDSFDEADVTQETNIDSIVKELDRSKTDDAARKKEVRRKLEELAEEQSFESTYAIEFEEN